MNSSLYHDGRLHRSRYSRSPPGVTLPPSKRPKITNTNDPYPHHYGNRFDQYPYFTSLYITNIHPKLSDIEIRNLCDANFSKYGLNSVQIFHRNQDRVISLDFRSHEGARKACYENSRLLWRNIQVILEPVYSHPIISSEQRFHRYEPFTMERSYHRGTSRSPSPYYNHSSARYHHSMPSAYPSLPSRLPSQRYSPHRECPQNFVEHADGKSYRKRQHSASSSTYRHHQLHHYSHHGRNRRSRSRSENSHESVSHRPILNDESNVVQEPTRSLRIENLDRDITEALLNERFGRFGTIEEIDLNKPSSSTKRAYAFIRFENMNMAIDARRIMDGQLIGRSNCKITFGKILPTKHLWIGNISTNMKKRDLEYAFSRYGQIKTFEYSTGNQMAIVTYMDVDDAIKARSKLTGTTEIYKGQIIRDESAESPATRSGFRIDYLDHLTSRRFAIARPQERSSIRHESTQSSLGAYSHHSASTHDPLYSPSIDIIVDDQKETDIKTEPDSDSPLSTAIISTKQRRSTDRTESSVTSAIPIAGRTFYGPLGSYLSHIDTANINNINDLIILCEQLNSSATTNSTALSTVYPVQFILKSRAYDARMHFLAGSPSLTSILLGQPGDLIAAKTELKITQRLRLDQCRLDELENNLRSAVSNSLSLMDANSNRSIDRNSSDSIVSISSRKKSGIANQTKFALLIASTANKKMDEVTHFNEDVKTEIASSNRTTNSNDCIEVKKENIEENTHEPNDQDDLSLSCLISYLIEKEAAGFISVPFHPTYQNENTIRQETALLHIFAPCEFSKKLLKIICPKIQFSIDANSSMQTNKNDEHIMLVIVHKD